MDFNPFLDIDHPFDKGIGLQPFDDPIASHFTKHTPNLSFGNTSSRWQTSHMSEGQVDLWPNDTGYRLPESWSQTIDTLLSQTIDGHSPIGHSSSDTNESASGDSALLFVSTTSSGSTSSSYPNSSTISQPEQAWQTSTLSTSPSDPFNILPTDPKPEKISPPTQTSRLPSDSPPSFGELPPPLKSQPTQSTTPYGDSQEPSLPSSYRQLFDPIPKPPSSNPTIPRPQFVAPADLALTRLAQPSVLGAPAAHSTPIRNIPAEGPTLQAPSVLAHQAATRGLSGWKPANRTDNPLATSHPPLASLVPGLKPPCPRPSVRLPPNIDITSFTVPQPRERTRGTTFPSKSSTFDLFGSDDGGDDDDDDDDIYQPSSSPARSTCYSRGNSPCAVQYPERGTRGTSLERQSRRGKGKAKGSAALALAVVTQMSKFPEQDHDIHIPSYLGGGGGDNGMANLGVHLRGVRPGRKRKNTSIPLPVPVPHLIKKSRGRKVPYIPQDGNVNSSGSSSSSSEASASFASEVSQPTPTAAALSAGPVRSSRGSRGRKSATPYSLVEGGERAYRCEVSGCGKCFVRGEHLKRHIRSIHTYDKPHPCPYSGCDKSFSRRDNLGQHVRIHLQA